MIFFGICQLWGTEQDRNPNKQALHVTADCTLIDLYILNDPFIPQIHLVYYGGSFDVFLNLICQVFSWRIFASVFIREIGL